MQGGKQILLHSITDVTDQKRAILWCSSYAHNVRLVKEIPFTLTLSTQLKGKLQSPQTDLVY